MVFRSFSDLYNAAIIDRVMNKLAALTEDLHDCERHRPPSLGAVRLGSNEHLRLFCLELLETHDPYRPAVIDWPVLSPDALRRVTSLPIWNMAVQKEGFASISVASFAQCVKEPLLRQAIDMNAREEFRHKEVLSHLVNAYGIELEEEPAYSVPADREWAWLAIGYGECIDSFFAFGLFETARRSGYFPAELIETFDPVIREEGRHIIFFVNWVAWKWRNLRWWRRPLFALKIIAVWCQLIRDRVSIATRIDVNNAGNDVNFTATGAAAIGARMRPREMLDLCLSENDRRLAPYDPRLLRPGLVPALARIARKFMKDDHDANS
jgi:hypothetical protein